MKPANVLALASCLMIATAAAPAAKKEPLSRSIYVPVAFSVPPEIDEALLIWIGDEARPRRARAHTFLFTYFPDRGDRFWPDRVEVRVQALGVCAGGNIDTNFIVTPMGIRTSSDSLAFDMEALSKQLRMRRRDLHVTPKTVKIRCAAFGAATHLPEQDPLR
jgi:hypothetical protein